MCFSSRFRYLCLAIGTIGSAVAPQKVFITTSTILGKNHAFLSAGLCTRIRGSIPDLARRLYIHLIVVTCFYRVQYYFPNILTY